MNQNGKNQRAKTEETENLALNSVKKSATKAD